MSNDSHNVSLVDNEQLLEGLLARDWTRLGGAQPGGRTYEVTSPYSRQVIARVGDATADDVLRVVADAKKAFFAWSRLTVARRAELLFALADAIEARSADFSVLDAIDSGAPFSVMRLDVKVAVDGIRYYAGLGLESKGYTVPASANLHYTELQPYGVVARIVPFNHPILFAASRIAAPLVAGNTVVLKPSETTPLSALLLGEVVSEILPPGVVSMLVGNGPEVPDTLVRHPDVIRIGFTGSSAVGRAIQRSAAEVGVKHVSLELGGKNALIAFPDADPDEVARGIVHGMNFTWSGQSCGSTSRLLVHEDIADAVLVRAREMLAGRRFISPLDPASVQGTMVSERQYDRALGYIDDAVTQGADVAIGGGVPAGVEKGLFIQPTFLDNVLPSFRVAQEEVFGPVVSVIRWTSEEDAVRIANSVEYGLTGSVFTNDVRRAHRVARELDAGVVWINGAANHFQGLPFGGWKNSGIETEEGIEELLSYSRSKSVTVFL